MKLHLSIVYHEKNKQFFPITFEEIDKKLRNNFHSFKNIPGSCPWIWLGTKYWGIPWAIRHHSTKFNQNWFWTFRLILLKRNKPNNGWSQKLYLLDSGNKWSKDSNYFQREIFSDWISLVWVDNRHSLDSRCCWKKSCLTEVAVALLAFSFHGHVRFKQWLENY